MVGVRIIAVCFLVVVAAVAQTSQGELRFSVADTTGRALPAQIQIESDANGMHKSVHAASDGTIAIQHLPFGVYRYTVTRAGFVPALGLAEVRSPLPVNIPIVLNLGEVETVIETNEAATLVDPHQTGSAKTLGSRKSPKALARSQAAAFRICSRPSPDGFWRQMASCILVDLSIRCSTWSMASPYRTIALRRSHRRLTSTTSKA